MLIYNQLTESAITAYNLNACLFTIVTCGTVLLTGLEDSFGNCRPYLEALLPLLQPGFSPGQARLTV